MLRSLPLLSLAILASLLPVVAYADAPDDPVGVEDGNITFTTPDDDFSLQLTGRFQIQALYRYEDGHHASDLFLRRIQPNLEGHILDRRLTYRLRPDISRQATLRDAFVDYRLRDRALRIRVGQFNIPFDWERNVAPPYFANIERSRANQQLGWPTGRDVGFLLHGSPSARFDYGIGLFNGQGANRRRSGDDIGFSASARLRYHPTGRPVSQEALLTPTDDLRLSIGAGGYGAVNSGAREDWTPFLDVSIPDANLLAATTDIQLQWGRLSAHGAAYFRHVNPDGPDAYEGYGLNAHLGGLAIDQRLFVGSRLGLIQPVDLDGQPLIIETRANLHFFQRGHDSKWILEAGLDALDSTQPTQRGYTAALQYQLLY